MPELPEVETIRRGLEKHLVNHIIEDVEVRLAKQVIGDTGQVIGGRVIGIRRYGKGLVVDLSNGYSIAIHVKMTGQLIYRGTKRQSNKGTEDIKVSAKVGTLPGKFTHVIFHLDEGGVLYYNDARQFGWIHILPTDEVMEHSFFKKLGPEVLKDLTFEKFKHILLATKGPVKSLLLEQQKMSGVGNIYANDALYRAKIHPKRPANSLAEDEIRHLFHALEEVLKKGLEAGGSSEWAYVNALGEEGSYQKLFLVYGKDGKPCGVCGTIIERTKIGGRGTFFCMRCQR